MRYWSAIMHSWCIDDQRNKCLSVCICISGIFVYFHQFQALVLGTASPAGAQPGICGKPCRTALRLNRSYYKLTLTCLTLKVKPLANFNWMKTFQENLVVFSFPPLHISLWHKLLHKLRKPSKYQKPQFEKRCTSSLPSSGEKLSFLESWRSWRIGEFCLNKEYNRVQRLSWVQPGPGLERARRNNYLSFNILEDKIQPFSRYVCFAHVYIDVNKTHFFVERNFL